VRCCGLEARSRARYARVRCIAVACFIALPAIAGGQAWIAPAGEGTVAVVHQYVHSDVHLNKEGIGTRALGSEAFHAVALEGSYGLRQRLAVEGSVVWLATKWTGPGPAHGPVDTGIYHGALQDFRFAVRYQLTDGAVAVAPFVAVGVPSHAYETRGHSAFGRDLSEIQLGVSAGRGFRWFRGAGHVHGTVAYAASEGVAGVDLDLDHVNGDLEVAASVATRVQVRGFTNWQVMRDGLQLGPQVDHYDLSPVHDRFARASYLQVGAGATIAAGPRATFSMSAFATLTGRNVHAVRGLVTGLTWRLGGGFKVRPASRDRS
jgi:hypothetical protein